MRKSAFSKSLILFSFEAITSSGYRLNERLVGYGSENSPCVSSALEVKTPTAEVPSGAYRKTCEETWLDFLVF